jgi:hypothetical protein
MPRSPKITDEELLRRIAAGESRSAIARQFQMSRQAVSQRVRVLLERHRVTARVQPRTAAISVWNAAEAAEDNYRRTAAILDDSGLTYRERFRVVREMRRHIALSLESAEHVQAVASAQRFIHDTLAALAAESPEIRERVMGRIRAADMQPSAPETQPSAGEMQPSAGEMQPSTTVRNARNLTFPSVMSG